MPFLHDEKGAPLFIEGTPLKFAAAFRRAVLYRRHGKSVRYRDGQPVYPLSTDVKRAPLNIYGHRPVWK